MLARVRRHVLRRHDRLVRERARGRGARYQRSPGRMATITTSTALTGPIGDTGLSQRQRLVVVPGQFVADAIDDEHGIGTQTLFGRVAGRILYSSSDDFDPPQLNAIDGVVTGGSQAAFAVDGATRPASSRCWCCSTTAPGGARWIPSTPTGAGKVPPPCRVARAPCATSSRPSTPPATSESAATRASRSPARRASSSRRRRLRARTWR